MRPIARETKLRKPNAVDFWRGFALVNIFLSHMPGNTFERLSHRHYSLADAELFVFLAGWSLRLATARDGSAPFGSLAAHAVERAAKLYRAQIAMTIAALAIMLVAANTLGDHAIMRWGNAGALQDQPVRAWIGLVVLTHQLQYFDIMPLYVVLGLSEPLLILLDRRSPWLLLASSALLWAVAGLTRLDVPTWPIAGGWFFNPLAWQLSFVLGFLIAGKGAPARLARDLTERLFWPALAVAVTGGVAVAFHLTPDATRVDFSGSSLLFSKCFIGPARLVHFLAMAIACSRIFPVVLRRASPIAAVASLLGRHTLPVFAAASLLSLVGRICKHVVGKGVFPAFVMVAFGLTVLALTAWVSEWRKGHRRGASSPLSLRQRAST